MTESVRDWLPPGAYTPDAVGAVLAEILEGWAGRWLVQRTVEVSAVHDEGMGRRIASGPTYPVEGAIVRAVQSGRGRRHLLEAALAVSLTEQAPTAADHRLLDALAGEIMADVVAALDGFLAPMGNGEGGRTATIDLALESGEIATLSFPAHAIAAALKTRLPRVRKAGGSPGARMAALGATRLSIEAIVGRASLMLEDMEGLGVGDVLVLDRALEDRIDMRLAGRSTVLARGRLDRNDGRASLIF